MQRTLTEAEAHLESASAEEQVRRERELQRQHDVQRLKQRLQEEKDAYVTVSYRIGNWLVLVCFVVVAAAVATTTAATVRCCRCCHHRRRLVIPGVVLKLPQLTAVTWMCAHRKEARLKSELALREAQARKLVEQLEENQRVRACVSVWCLSSSVLVGSLLPLLWVCSRCALLTARGLPTAIPCKRGEGCQRRREESHWQGRCGRRGVG